MATSLKFSDDDKILTIIFNNGKTNTYNSKVDAIIEILLCTVNFKISEDEYFPLTQEVLRSENFPLTTNPKETPGDVLARIGLQIKECAEVLEEMAAIKAQPSPEKARFIPSSHGNSYGYIQTKTLFTTPVYSKEQGYISGANLLDAGHISLEEAQNLKKQMDTFWEKISLKMN